MATRCEIGERKSKQRLLARNESSKMFFAREASGLPKPAAKCPSDFFAEAACSRLAADPTPPTRNMFRWSLCIR